MLPIYHDALYNAHTNNDPKLFFAVLGMALAKVPPPKLLRSLSDPAIRAKIIRHHYSGNGIRPMVKKICYRGNKSLSLKLKGEWENLPIADFNLRSITTLNWLDQRVLNSVDTLEPLTPPDNTDALIEWYARLAKK